MQLVARIKTLIRENLSCIKMHATDEIMNARKVVNNVPCVILSCIKMHATYETANNVRILNEMPEIGLKPTQKMLILQKKA